jgi:uncharacterized SAM-binding protein YcdF (DUF218 family)
MLEAGAPECDSIHENRSLNTREQAVEVVRMAQQRGWKKLILVASHEHQYRAYLTFLREVLDTRSGITLYNAPARNLDWFVDKGWGTRFDRLEAEILRIEKYTEFGHLANAQEVIEYQQWKEKNLTD